MLKNHRVGAIVFYVKDIERSLKFYRDSLGLDARYMPPEKEEDHVDDPYHGPWFIIETANTSLIFFKGDQKPGMTPVVVFSLAEGGINGVVEELVRRQVQIVTPVSKAPGGWTADFADPDGHTLSLYQTEAVPK